MPKSVSRAVLGNMQFTLDSPNTSRCFALGASNVCLVGQNPTCAVLASYGREGLWSYEYGHEQTKYAPPLKNPALPPTVITGYK